MTTQPEALRLANDLQAVSSDPWAKYWERCLQAAAELRRLHAVNVELLSALQTVLSESYDGPLHDDYRRQARAAIAKAVWRKE